MENIGFGEILIIVVLLLIFFGGKKIPELMKGLGQGIKSFKKALSDDDSENPDKK